MASLRAPPTPPCPVEDRETIGSCRRPMGAVKIWNYGARLAGIRSTHLGILPPMRRTSSSSVVARASQELTEYETIKISEGDRDLDPFEEFKHRFLTFKQQNCVENPVHYENLSQAQMPKFMVIACADSRVCPSKVLGFQPGEAFTIRNVANLVPPFEHGASETSAALEFAVNSLEVRNILVVGHSRCGGIQALMSMSEKNATRSFIKDWVSIAKSARLSTKAVASHLSFEQQCRNCEKESINGSLLNLLTYPWIEKKVIEGKLAIHGGYYDFIDCTFEKWTLVYRQKMEGGSKYGMKNHIFWS